MMSDHSELASTNTTARTSTGQNLDVAISDIEVEVVTSEESTTPVSGSDKDSGNSTEIITITLDSDDDDDDGRETVNLGGGIRIRNEGDGIFDREGKDDLKQDCCGATPSPDKRADCDPPEKKKQKRDPPTQDFQGGRGINSGNKDDLESHEGDCYHLSSYPASVSLSSSSGFTITTNNSNQSMIKTTVKNGSTPPPELFSTPNLGNHQEGQQTASQLFFAAKQNGMMKSSASPNGLRQSSDCHPIPIPGQPTAISSSAIIGPRGPPPFNAAPRMAVFVTTSGQVLGTGVVTAPCTQSGNPLPQTGGVNPGMVRAQQQQRPRCSQVILPTTEPSAPVPVTTKNFWSRPDDDEEEDGAILAALTGVQPNGMVDFRNSRKQKMTRRNHSSEEIVMESDELDPTPPSPSPSRKNNNVHPSGSQGIEIDFCRYADVVFEEVE